ncbi:MAG: hypothetical protein RJB57_308, partial [Actinomycetota bacterium]
MPTGTSRARRYASSCRDIGPARHAAYRVPVRRRRHLTVAALVTAVLVILPASADAAVPGHTDTVVVDTGFRVKRDGFSFANWSGLSGVTSLSRGHMFQLLKDAGRCTDDGVNPSCTLRNGQVVDLEHLNEHLSAGRCEGMAVLAARIFMRRTRLTHLSRRVSRTFDLTVRESADEIAYWWATQLAPNIQQYAAGRRMVTAHDLAHEILDRMRNKVMLTVGIYTDDWAHTLLAVRVSYRRDVTRVTVYDPNFPGETRVLTLDHRTDSWTYPRALLPDGSVRTVRGRGAGSLDYVPVAMRSNRTQWELLG